MTSEILNRVKLEARRVRDNGGKTRLGLVTSYDKVNFAVKVALQPDGTNTGWIPLGSPWVGNGWGMFFAPNIDDQIEVEFQEDGAEVPLATMRIFDDQNRPLPVPSGEMWLVHASGAAFKLTNDGKMLLSSGEEVDIGNAAQAFLPLMTQAFKAVFDAHEHSNGNDGNNTGPPTQAMPTSCLTTYAKAN